MNYKTKVYLGLITQNDINNINELTSVYNYFDGIFATDHESSDGTYEILQERKKDGDIKRLPFLNRHDFAMNGFLFNPKLRRGSWVLLRDGGERVNENFAKDIHDFTLELEKRGIHKVYQYSKLLLFKKYNHQFFFGSPHWSLLPHDNIPAIAIETHQGFENPESYCYSVRHKYRPRHHFIDHFFKYYASYSGYSNHLLLGRDNNIPEYQVHEQVREKFIDYCLDVLKIETTVESFKSYLLNNKLVYETKFFLNYEIILNNFYCFHILNQDIEEIIARNNRNELFKIE